MRSNRASDACSSTETSSSRPMGKYKRLCNVVKATIVPADITLAPPPEIRYPASR